MPPRELSPEKRQAILEAAVACFCDKGFAHTRIADIAAQAGIGKGTVYEYVDSKEQLLVDACLHLCQVNERAISIQAGGAALVPTALGTVPEPGIHPVKASYWTLRAVLEVLLGRSQQEMRLFMDLMHLAEGQADMLEPIRATFGAKLGQWRQAAQTLYARGREAGFFRDLGDGAWPARLIVAVVDGLIFQRQLDPEESVSETAHGIAAVWVRLQMVHPERLEDYLQ